MLSYCLKCRKETESKNQEVTKTKKGRITFHQNVQCAVVKYQNLLNSKKLVGY